MMEKKHLHILNSRLYELGEIYPKIFKHMEKIAMPVKSVFYIQKNLNTISDAAQDLDKARLIVVKKYGVKNDDGSYRVPQELINEANNELQELLQQQQEIELYPIPLSWFEGVSLTAEQVNSLLIMIEEDKEEKKDEDEE